MKNTNWLAVIVSAITGFFIGFLWYGPIFQQQWMENNGITLNPDDEMIMYKYGEEMSFTFTPMIVNLLGMFVLALLINWFINKTNYTSLTKGLTIGLLIGIMISINIVLGNLFAFNSMTITLIDCSYIILVTCLMGLILGAWRKKAS